MKQVVLVLVNYYKETELVSFVKTFLSHQDYLHLHIVVVDNGSHDKEIIQSLGEMKNITLLFPEHNLGYFGAAQSAYVNFTEGNQENSPHYFIVSNFDLSFDQSHFISAIVEAQENEGIAVIGPSIVSSLNGAALNPMYKQRLGLRHLNRLIFITDNYSFYFFYQLLHYLKRSFSHRVINLSEPREDVYAIHGSMMIFSKKYFDHGGTLQYDSFLYGEEIFVAEQCRKIGMSISVNYDLSVIHHEHSTTGKIKDRKHMQFLNDSLRYLRSTFYHV